MKPSQYVDELSHYGEVLTEESIKDQLIAKGKQLMENFLRNNDRPTLM